MINWREVFRCSFLFSALCLSANAIGFASEKAQVCFATSCFQAEVARTQAEKQLGLMQRAGLAQDQGKLFIYESETRPDFWMKNMLFSLDFVWLNKEWQVVDISENIPACENEKCPTISSREPVHYVLEIAAGSVRKTGIKIGDYATIQ